MFTLFADTLILAAGVDRNSWGYKAGGAVVTVVVTVVVLSKLRRLWRSPLVRILVLLGAGTALMSIVFVAMLGAAKLLPPVKSSTPRTIAPIPSKQAK